MPETKTLTDTEKLQQSQWYVILLYQKLLDAQDEQTTEKLRAGYQPAINATHQILEAWRKSGMLHDEIQAAMKKRNPEKSKIITPKIIV